LIRAILFDYGGTLVTPNKSFEEAKPDALRHVYALLSRSGLTMPCEEYVERNNYVFRRYSALERKQGRDISDLKKYQELIHELFPARSEAWRRRAARLSNDAFWEVVVRNYPVRKDARRTLSELKSMGIRLAIVSNHHNHEALVKHLRDLGIASDFSRVFSSVRSGVRKPDRRIFESCLSSLRVRDPQQAVFVGDSLENDVGGARSAGLRTILILDDGAIVPDQRGRGRSEAKPDFTIRELSEIPGIVSSL
jgi:putative hydrolase of the HAD superfamily